MHNLKITLACLLFITTSNLYAQSETYELNTSRANFNDHKKKEYVQALNKCNLDQYRLKSDRRILRFRNEMEVELLSAQELITKGIKFNGSRIVTSEVPFVHTAVFYLNENSQIIETHQSNQKTSRRSIKPNNK